MMQLQEFGFVGTCAHSVPNREYMDQEVYAIIVKEPEIRDTALIQKILTSGLMIQSICTKELVLVPTVIS